jgi:K+-sensing histidine kinase KdpD
MHSDRDIFQNALDAIIILDASGAIKDVNPSALDLLHKRRRKVVGLRLENFFYGNLTKKRGEVSLKRSKETVLEYTKAKSSDGTSLLYFFRDISDLKQEILRREHFLGIAGHELKNPLAAIKALNHMLLYQKKVQKDEFLKEHIKKVNVKTDVLTKLIMDLLDVTKIKHRRLELNMEKVGYKDCVSEIVEDFHNIQKTHKVELSVKTDVYIKIDKMRIGQVVMNLLKNAAKYSPGTDTIFLNVEKTKKYLVTEIIDFGMGIPPEGVENIFNLYYRLPNSEKSFDGLGVGLYIANQIVKAHGGKMKVKSAVNRGSQFIFYLPLTSKLKTGSNIIETISKTN